jgi:hypothetical protein
VKIKSQKDFFSGLMFLVVGIAFAWGATTYNIGEGARMGPGYFPLVLGIILAAIGAFTIFESLVIETEDGEKVGAIAWRPLAFIIGANIVFGILLAGLPKFGVPAMGLVIAIFALVAVSSMADSSHDVGEIWIGSLAGLVLGTLVVALIAKYLVMAIEPATYMQAADLAAAGWGVKGWNYFAQFGGRVVAFGGTAYLFWKFAPLARGAKEYAILTMILICLSVWSFVSLLSLQFQVWPTFLTN